MPDNKLFPIPSTSDEMGTQSWHSTQSLKNSEVGFKPNDDLLHVLAGIGSQFIEDHFVYLIRGKYQRFDSSLRVLSTYLG